MGGGRGRDEELAAITIGATVLYVSQPLYRLSLFVSETQIRTKLC